MILRVNLFERIMNTIRGKYKKRKISKQKTVRFMIHTGFDDNTEFEGENYIGENNYLQNVKLGYGGIIQSNSTLKNALVGRYACVGPGAKLVSGQHPTSKFVSVHQAFFSKTPITGESYVNSQKYEEAKYVGNSKYQIVIGADTWIGANVTFMEGVTIGDGAVVATGSVVVKDVEPYTIVGGVPAKVIRKRFSEDEIEWLLANKWWNKDINWIKTHAEYFEDIKVLREIVDEENRS